jgi:hypothetical protein
VSQRPKTLKNVVEQGQTSPRDFDLALRDWIHEIKKWRKTSDTKSAVKPRPALLAGQWHGANEADALIAAYAEHACNSCLVKTPTWCFEKERVLPKSKPSFPWDNLDENEKKETIRATPPAFARHNVFCQNPDFPIHPLITNGWNIKKFRENLHAHLSQKDKAFLHKLAGEYLGYINNPQPAKAWRTRKKILKALTKMDPTGKITKAFNLEDKRHLHLLPSELWNALTSSGTDKPPTMP